MTARFVVVLHDAAGASVRQRYELHIDPRPMTAKNIEMWLFAAIVFGSLVWWRRTLKGARGWGKTVQSLATAYGRGQMRVTAPVGHGVMQDIELPEGIAYYSTVRDAEVRKSRFIGGLTVMLTLAWMMRWLLR
jgi:hypothetical protein